MVVLVFWKKRKRMKNSIIFIALITVAILFPTNGQAADEVMPIAQPVVEESSVPMESSVSVAETTLAAPEEISTQNVSGETSLAETPAQIAPSEAIPGEVPVSTAPSTPAETPAQTASATAGETPVQTIQGETVQEEAMDSNAQQGMSILPLLIVLIGLVIVVAVIVAVSTAVSSVAVAVDDEEE